MQKIKIHSIKDANHNDIEKESNYIDIIVRSIKNMQSLYSNLLKT